MNNSLTTSWKPRLAKIICLILIFASFITANQRAESAPPGGYETDVQALLINDSAVAQLKQRLTAKEISNVDYNEQAKELAKTRASILARFDRQGQRELVAAYNMSRKDLAQAAAAEKRQSAIDAKEAAAAARADTARQAAEKLAWEKQTAKDEAALVKADAETMAAQVVQRQKLLYLKHFNVPLSDSNELHAVDETIHTLAEKYSKTGALAKSAQSFQSQSNDLFLRQLADAKPGWVMETFPEPERVIAELNDQTKSMAALYLLTRYISRYSGIGQTAAAQEKLTRYSLARDRIDPPAGSHHAANARLYDSWIANPQFQIEIARRYAGPVGENVIAEIQREEFAKWDALQRQKMKRILGLLLVLVFLFPLAFLAVGQSGRRDTFLPDPAFDLPEHLRNVEVFRKSYRISADGGIVFQREAWQETTSTTTTSQPVTYTTSGAYYGTATTSTTTTSTTYHRYWIRTPDGRETWYKFSDDAFPAAKGQFISTISLGKSVLLAYNHNSKNFVKLPSGINGANRVPGRWLVLAGTLIMGIGCYCVQYAVPKGYQPGVASWTYGAVMGAFIGAIISTVYVLILKLIVQKVRYHQFNRRYAEPIKATFTNQTEAFRDYFAAHPATISKDE